MSSRTIYRVLMAIVAGGLSLAASATTPGTGPLHSARDLWSSNQARPNETVQADADHSRSAPFRYVSLSPIYFDHNQYLLSRESRMALDAAVQYLKKHKNSIKRVLLEGYTDDTASMRYNDKLAAKRIEMVRNYLLMHGVDASLLVATAHGERAPSDINWTPLGRARNRQVAIHTIE